MSKTKEELDEWMRSMTFPMLEAACKKYGVDLKGKRYEIINRLIPAVYNANGIPLDVGITSPPDPAATSTVLSTSEVVEESEAEETVLEKEAADVEDNMEVENRGVVVGKAGVATASANPTGPVPPSAIGEQRQSIFSPTLQGPVAN